jgi:hypothetical protein
MSGHGRQGIDSTAFDSLLTMSNSTIKLVLTPGAQKQVDTFLIGLFFSTR